MTGETPAALLPTSEAWKEALPRLFEELRGILVVLNSDRPLQSILDYLVTEGCVLLGSQACVLYRSDPELAAVLIEARAGLPSDSPPIGQLPMEPGGGLGSAVLDRLILNPSPVVQTDIADSGVMDALQLPTIRPATRTWFRALVSSHRSLLSVPLVVKETYYGSLGFYYTTPRRLSAEDVAMAVTFGSQSALAIENARLRQQAEQAAVLQERSRLARDLHDSVTQSLYSLTLLAEAARRLARSGDLPQVQTAITRLGEIGQQALKEMRLLVYELRPLVLRREGLARALGHRLETVERRAGVEALLAVNVPQSLPPSFEEQLYHLVQEALNNTLKHAAATTVSVHIEVRDSRLWLEVVDNGRGFDPDASDEGGIGLLSMRERVEKLGGEFAIRSAKGQGTTVTVTLDLPERSEERYG